jgi:hypothetical protein
MGWRRAMALPSIAADLSLDPRGCVDRVAEEHDLHHALEWLERLG